MFHLNNFQIYAYSEKSFTIVRNCWHSIASKITKTKRLDRSDSIYLSSILTQVVPKRPLHHHCAVNCPACYQLVPCSLVWRLYKPKCETKPIQYMSCLRNKRQEEWVDRWSMERIKCTHPSPRPPPVTSNSQCYTSIIIKHKEIATFPSSILHLLLKKVNRKVQGVPQAQVASYTMLAGSKNTQDRTCHVNTKNASLVHARLTHACHDSPWKHHLSPKMW